MRPNWDEFFMFNAIFCATRHSCLKRGVGAVIVKDKRIIGGGYNGAAPGLNSCLDRGYCYCDDLAMQESQTNSKEFAEIREDYKLYCLAVHAEVNAISQCRGWEARGATLYITNFPCPRCTQDVIITNGITAVRVWKDYLGNPALTIDEKRASERKLLEAGISLSYVHISPSRIKEFADYMSNIVGERTKYVFEKGE
ncbi:MAG: deaminase [bacterium]|nr:deaminase [bacterium]